MMQYYIREDGFHRRDDHGIDQPIGQRIAVVLELYGPQSSAQNSPDDLLTPPDSLIPETILRKETCIVHRHGRPQFVRPWFGETRLALQTVGDAASEQTSRNDRFVLIEIDYPLDPIGQDKANDARLHAQLDALNRKLNHTVNHGRPTAAPTSTEHIGAAAYRTSRERKQSNSRQRQRIDHVWSKEDGEQPSQGPASPSLTQPPSSQSQTALMHGSLSDG